MKLNWFSPLPPAKTEIAAYALRLLAILSQSAEILAWTDQPEWDSEVEQYVKVRHYSSPDLPWSEVNQADLNIYHIGNNPHFHRNIWEVSRRCPGLVILHDLKLHHFFEWIYHRQPGGRETYLQEMTRYYGLAGRNAGEQYWRDELSIEFMADHYPLTPLALENALGVLTHTREAFNVLSQSKRWLTAYVPLPYTPRQLNVQVAKSNSPPYQLIVFGYISTNRRLDSVLNALANLPQKDCFHLNIYGDIWDLNYVTSKIHTLGLDHLVTIHGFVEEMELELALANAHLAINLRYPTMGEASASQLRIWNHALPSLVTNIGWYASLPETAVIHIPVETEVSEIQKSLSKFLSAPDTFYLMGHNGKLLLEPVHNPELYGQEVIKFAERHNITSHPNASLLSAKIGFHYQSMTDGDVVNVKPMRLAEAIHFITSRM